ncbi:TPA: hypothetical protein ACHOYS_001945 [Klebsiella quasipneumoniae subsp. similipneumoniae]
MQNEIEQIAQQNKMSIEFVTWFFNEKKSACGEHWFLMLGAMWEGWKGRSIEMDKLAAENVGLKKFIKTECFVGQDKPDICPGLISTRYVSADGYEPETPATDRIVAGIKADGVEDEPFGFVSRNGDMVVIQLNGDQHIRDGMPVFVKELREGADKC